MCNSFTTQLNASYVPSITPSSKDTKIQTNYQKEQLRFRYPVDSARRSEVRGKRKTSLRKCRPS